MDRRLALILISMIAINGIVAAPRPQDLQATCSPWLGYCLTTDQCCRDLICLGYLVKCVPGKIADDKRPIGDGPFPPTRSPFHLDVDNTLEIEID